MDILDKKSYSNYTFEGIVVNTETDMDPENKNRIQIYIPSLQIEYSNLYVTYAKLDKNGKENSADKSKFPWATSSVKDLVVGNKVIGCNLNNENSEYVILGLNVNDDMDSSIVPVGGNGILSISGNASGLLDLAMPIILSNEIGVSTDAWPNNIPDKNYALITPYDKGCSCTNKPRCMHSGGWSIGLIQWHHGRAFNLMFEIAKADSDWKNKSDNQNLDIIKDLESSVNNNSTYNYANKYTDNYHPIEGTQPYNFIKNMLSSDTGKKVQREKASEDIAYSIKLVTSEPYNISNPAIVIWLVDILNQYGNGKTTTIKKAAEISAVSGDMINQLEQFRTWCESNLGDYSLYKNRRNKTFEYVKQLYNSGKLSLFGGINLSSDPNANKGGQLLWPSPGCQEITSKYGNRTYWNEKKQQYVTGFHTGVDLARNGGALNQQIIAAHAGTVQLYKDGTMGGYGNLIILTNGNMKTYYAHQNKFADNLKSGMQVNAGDVIGYVGDTGNSTGAHLHFEVRINNATQNPLPYIKKS